MYAVFKTGGKQYRVSPGDTLRVENLSKANGENFKFDDVLLVEEDGKVIVGEDNLKKACVSAHVVESGLARKIIIFKKKRRKNYRRKHGHRQPYTTICIDKIQTG